MINLKIDPEFQSQIPPLTDDEFKQLEENILKEGKLLSPLIVWNNTLVDGHNRYAILQKHPEIYFSTMPLPLNSYTDVLYVFPDSVCEKLLPVMRNRYITTSESISYENARELEQTFSNEYPEITDTGVSYGIRLSTLQINSTKANNFVLQATMLYGAVVLMVICLTILSLQQLLDAGKYNYRFGVLRKLGVEEEKISRLVLKQLSVWFGLPILVAVIVAMRFKFRA